MRISEHVLRNPCWKKKHSLWAVRAQIDIHENHMTRERWQFMLVFGSFSCKLISATFYASKTIISWWIDACKCNLVMRHTNFCGKIDINGINQSIIENRLNASWIASKSHIRHAVKDHGVNVFMDFDDQMRPPFQPVFFTESRFLKCSRIDVILGQVSTKENRA